MTANDTDTKDREMRLTRMLDAPRARVWQAWTDPEHIVLWWGPNGFTTTTHEMQVRSGGTWTFIMHGPDGVDYPNRITYEEILEPELLVYTHGTGEADDPDQFRTTVTFEEVGDQTRVTLCAVFPSAFDFKRVVEESGAIEGGNQTLGRLADYVKTL